MLHSKTFLIAFLAPLATGQEMRSGAMESLNPSVVSSALSVMSASSASASASAASVSASLSAAATASPKPTQTGAANVNDAQYAAMLGGAAVAALNIFV